MPQIVDLASLSAAITDWVARTDLTGQPIVNLYIELAESEIINGIYDASGRVLIPPLRCSEMEFRDPNYQLQGELTPLPQGFLGFRSVRTNESPQKKMDYITPAFFNSTFASVDGLGSAHVYTIEGGQLRVPPGASDQDTLDIVYYRFVEQLTTYNTNWILRTFPNVYLFGALRYLASYCGMDSKVPFFQSAFIAQMAALHAGSKAVSYSGVVLAHNTIGVTLT